MNQSKSIRQCLWLIAAMKERGRITLRDLQAKWTADGMGDMLYRSAFNRYRDKIFQMFGLLIECDEQHRYYLQNPEEIDARSIESWMLSTMTVNTALADSAEVKDRIVLESVPEGEQHLPLIIRAIRHNRRLRLRYQKFGCEATEKTVEPYVLKLWGRRWYLLVFTGHHMATYSLDRLLWLEMTEETFQMPPDFSPEQYFGEFYGVLTDETVPMTDVVVRAYGKTAHYLRTLPLHHSQRTLQQTDEWTDYRLRLRPTADFVGELLKYDEGLEVRQPESLRLKICEKLHGMINKY